jgi:protein SCO1
MERFSPVGRLVDTITNASVSEVRGIVTRMGWRLGALGVLAAVLLVMTGCETAKTGQPLAYDQAAPDFTLTDQSGKPYRLRNQRGKVVLLNFGYSSCPDECPATLAQLAKARQMVGGHAEKVQVAFVTVDPTRDTGARLAEYLPNFDPSFMGLTGAVPDLEKVWTAYGVRQNFVNELRTPQPSVNHYSVPPGAKNYFLGHTAITFLIDGRGVVRAMYPAYWEADKIAEDLRKALGVS